MRVLRVTDIRNSIFLRRPDRTAPLYTQAEEQSAEREKIGPASATPATDMRRNCVSALTLKKSFPLRFKEPREARYVYCLWVYCLPCGRGRYIGDAESGTSIFFLSTRQARRRVLWRPLDN